MKWNYLYTTGKGLALSPLFPFTAYLHTIITPFLPSLCFSSLASHSTLSFSKFDRWSQPLITFMTLCWTSSKMSMSILYQGAQHWIHYFSCHLISAEQRGMITFLYLLVILPPKLISRYHWCRGFFHPRCRLCLSLPEIHSIYLAQMMSCPRVPELFHPHVEFHPVLPVLHLLQTW